MTALSDSEFRAQMNAAIEAHHATEVKIAGINGQIYARLDMLREDKEFADIVRAQEWIRAKPDIALTHREGAIHGMPDGWPEGIDGDEAIGAKVNAECDKLMLVPISHASTQKRTRSSLVSDFRSRIEGDN